MKEDDQFSLPVISLGSVAEALNAWQHASHHGGAVLRILGEPSSERIVALGESLGTLETPAVGLTGVKDGAIHEVKPTHEGIQDDRGVRLRSTTFWPIPAHTDGYNSKRPPRLVLLQVVCAGRGGDTTVCKLNNILPKIRTESLRLLTDSVYPFTKGTTPILSRTNADANYSIRFNLYEIEEHLRRDHNSSLVTAQHLTALSELVEILAEEEAIQRNRMHLGNGDILILDNTVMLHGRLSLDVGDEDRLLQRVWIR